MRLPLSWFLILIEIARGILPGTAAGFSYVSGMDYLKSTVDSRQVTAGSRHVSYALTRARRASFKRESVALRGRDVPYQAAPPALGALEGTPG